VVGMSELAIAECVAEVRAACRRPIDAAALARLLDWLRPNFRQILDRPGGEAHWADHGGHMRDNGRYLGALADFFGYEADVPVVGAPELLRAFTLVEAACRVGAPDRPADPRGTPAVRPHMSSAMPSP
jgi:hypothetical protein